MKHKLHPEEETLNGVYKIVNLISCGYSQGLKVNIINELSRKELRMAMNRIDYVGTIATERFRLDD